MKAQLINLQNKLHLNIIKDIIFYMNDSNKNTNKPGRFWGITFICNNCGEFRWRMNGNEHSKEKFDSLSKEHESNDYLLLSNAMDNIMCWVCQFKKKKNDPSFEPPQSNFLDPEKSAYGKKWAEAVNELLLNACFETSQR